MRPVNRQRRSWSALALAVALAATRRAHAAEDAGTVSPLALGAGNRALALGGAYGAIADDASAWMWNPAGLGHLQRAELQLTHNRSGIIDLTEQYAGVGLPSWRWGTFAVAYRQIGVEGIEGRDTRNVPTGDALAARESEAALAYGLAVHPAWSLGLVGRARRTAVGDRAAGALAADAGVLVTPARLGEAMPRAWDGLQFGLALRNAVQPRVRLDLDEVPDPRALRLAAAWQRPLARGRLLAAVDLERAEGVAPRLHAGLEWRALSLLDARVGLDGGWLSAGTSFRVRGVSVDYAFTDDPLATQHRMGLTFAFGRGVEDSRRLAEQAREAELERALAAGFESRRAEQSRRLRDEIAAARAAGDLARALETLATLRALEPGEAATAALHVELLVEGARAAERAGDVFEAATLFRRALTAAPGDSAARDGAVRCEALALRRAARPDSLQRRFQAALVALAGDDARGARAHLRRLVAAAPQDSLALALLARVEDGIDARGAQLLGQMARAADAGQWEALDRALDELRALAPGATLLARGEALARRARRDLAARPAAPVATEPARAADPRTRAEARRSYERALALMQAGHRDEALRWLEVVRTQDPTHAGAARLLVQEYQVRGLETFAAGRLEEAARLWRRALELAPGDPRTLAYLRRAQDHLDRTVGLGAE